MTGLKIETLHIGDEDVPTHLQPVVEAAATTSRSEYPRGGVVVASLGEVPVATLTIGESSINPRVAEVRKVLQWQEDERVATEGLRKAWQAIVARARLFYDGVYVDTSVAASIPEEVLASAGIATTGLYDVSSSEVRRLVGDER
jgi:hypothetical protein